MDRAVIPFRLEHRWLMVHAMMIREFLSSTPWLAVPGSTPVVPGVTIWRGRAIPVLDLARALQVGALSPMSQIVRAMVVEHSAGAVAVPIEAAREVTSIAEERIKPPRIASVPYSTGEFDANDTIVPIIDLDRIIHELGKASSGS